MVTAGAVMAVRTRSWPPGLLTRTYEAVRPPLAGILALGAAMTAVGIALDVASITAPIWISSLVLCSLASITALVLADPAADLLAAVPIGRGRRTIHRLSIAVPLTLFAAGAITVVPDALATRAGTAFPAMSVGALLALVSLAAAFDAWSAPRSASGAAAVPIGVVVVSRIITGDTWIGQLAVSWSTHPWVVLTVATCVAVAGHRR